MNRLTSDQSPGPIIIECKGFIVAHFFSVMLANFKSRNLPGLEEFEKEHGKQFATREKVTMKQFRATLRQRREGITRNRIGNVFFIATV